MVKDYDLTPDLVDQLGWYVYRLVDPSNGETFYVGKGGGTARNEDHIEQFAANDEEKEDSQDLKLQRIKEIKAKGLEVIHLIHRHQIADAKTAYQIEAALMDAYPGLSNRSAGHGSGEFGCRHLQEIIDEYSRVEFVENEAIILISINRSYKEDGKTILDAVRGCWRAKQKAEKYELVLAHRQGVVVGAFRPREWLPATPETFPWLSECIEGRIGFNGEAAEPSVAELYVGKRVPNRFRQKGAANPVRYIQVHHCDCPRHRRQVRRCSVSNASSRSATTRMPIVTSPSRPTGSVGDQSSRLRIRFRSRNDPSAVSATTRRHDDDTSRVKKLGQLRFPGTR
jgi:hypothetical protein